MDDFKIDFDRTVFIVDDATTAFIVAILAGDHAIHCIVEAKSGCCDSNLLHLIDFLLSGVTFKSKRTYQVPSPYFLVDKRTPLASLRNLAAFSRKMKEIRLDRDKVHVGGTNSALLCRIRSDKRKGYIEHGTGDYYHRILARTGTRSLKHSMIQFLFSALGLPSSHWNAAACGFTMCKLKDDTYHHVDYRNFNSRTVAIAMSGLIDLSRRNGNNVLLLAESDWHSACGVDGNTTVYNELNIEMVERNCHKDETIFIKFHPSVGLADGVKCDLVDKLKVKGYEVYSIAAYLPGKMGYYLPAEIIVSLCGITKIVCSESSVFWNVAHTFDGQLVSEAKLLEKYFPDKKKYLYVEFLNRFVTNGITVSTLDRARGSL